MRIKLGLHFLCVVSNNKLGGGLGMRLVQFHISQVLYSLVVINFLNLPTLDPFPGSKADLDFQLDRVILPWQLDGISINE